MACKYWRKEKKTISFVYKLFVLYTSFEPDFKWQINLFIKSKQCYAHVSCFFHHIHVLRLKEVCYGEKPDCLFTTLTSESTIQGILVLQITGWRGPANKQHKSIWIHYLILHSGVSNTVKPCEVCVKVLNWVVSKSCATGWKETYSTQNRQMACNI